MVGTVNCLGLGQCSVAVTADMAGDVLMDVELQHTAAGGVSRTDAKIIITVRTALLSSSITLALILLQTSHAVTVTVNIVIRLPLLTRLSEHSYLLPL